MRHRAGRPRNRRRAPVSRRARATVARLVDRRVFGNGVRRKTENPKKRVARRQHQPVVLGDQQIFQHRHAGKQPDVLEGAGHASLLGDEKFRQALELVEGAVRAREAALATVGQRFQFIPDGRIAVAKADASLARLVEPGDAIEHGSLAGAVRPDQRGDIALPRLKRQVIYRDQPAKAHGQVLDAEQNVAVAGHQP